ncbi:MAG: tRNA (adenosine(37)-N6)-dimethylallyltransferase MiaA [Thermaurantimonas sp.]
MKTLIVIGGPTASGKTDLAIRLAQYFDTQIISYDSRQFYREIPVVSAQPTSEQLSKAVHHCIGFRSISEPLNAADFALMADRILSEVFEISDVCIAVGGSGMYAKAWIEGLDNIPSAPQELRNSLEVIWQTQGIISLQKMLKRLDPDYYQRVDLSNHRRLIRALEVCIHTGRPYSGYLKKDHTSVKNFRTVFLGINPDRQWLHRQINLRVEGMIARGLFEEVMPLYSQRGLTPLQTVGCREIFDMMDGKLSRDECIEQIKAHTRQYARRQITWYKKVPDIIWLKQTPAREAIRSLAEKLISDI